MSTPVEDFVQAFITDRQQALQYEPFIQRAEAEGLPQIARMIRAIAFSDEARNRLLRHGMPNHAGDNGQFFVCPHCGLIYHLEAPEKCPVDETPGGQFEII